MLLKNGSATTYTRYYFSNKYETEQTVAGTKEMLYLCGDAYTAPAVFVKNANTTSWKLYFIGRDYLGSITHILTEQGVVQQELSYDAWGRLRDPQTLQVYARGSEPELFLGRGYTGHEHLSPCGGVGGGFGLINMNARLYDPLLGRFLSPDPYIQDPYNPHNYNRYAYCYNNPLKYTDPSGEIVGTVITFVFDFFTTVFTGGLDFTSAKARDDAWKRFDPSAPWSKTNLAWKIDMGLFKTNPNKSFWEQAWQLISRFTWEGWQTMIGNAYSHTRNFWGQVDRVDYFDGRTFVTNENSKHRNDRTFSNYANMNIKKEINGDFNDFLMNDEFYLHAYGHTIQSKYWGPLYLIPVAALSALSSVELWNGPLDGGRYPDLYDHDVFWTEMNANNLAAKYFKKYYGLDWKQFSERMPLKDPRK